MFPIFHLFGKEIPMYAFMAVVGLLTAGFIFCRRISKSGLDDNEAILFLFVLALGMYIGGPILFAVTNAKYWYLFTKVQTLKEFWTVFSFIFSGSVFYGGLICAFIFGLIYIKIRKLPRDIYMDNAAMFAPLFHGFARIGCFLAGCCYGVESNFGFSAKGNTISDIGEVTRFPVQLLESLCNFIIAAIIFLLLKKGILRGKVFYLYLAIYAVVRFFDEFLRGDKIRGFIFGFSTSQFISIFVEIFALTLLFIIPLIKKKKNENDETSL